VGSSVHRDAWLLVAMNRRAFLGSTIAATLSMRCVLAQAPTPAGAVTSLREAPSASERFARLKDGPLARLTPEEEAQRVITSPAPCGPPGRWLQRASLPVARSEMNWATSVC